MCSLTRNSTLKILGKEKEIERRKNKKITWKNRKRLGQNNMINTTKL